MKKCNMFPYSLSEFLIIFQLIFLALAPAAFSSDDAVLRIETGMHTAVIGRIGVDARNRFLVTGSHDKTVRVWDLEDGTLLKTLRPPIGHGKEGKINAVAISPDGGTVAAGGYTGYEWDEKYSIYLFDRATGVMTGRITGLPNDIKHIAYSPKGRFLAATLGADGIRIFRAGPGGGTLAGEDRDYGGRSYWADFAPDGRLVTACLDGFIRLYAPVGNGDLKLLKKKTAPEGKEPFSAVFSPDGTRIAVGFNDSAKVDVLSAADLSHLYSPDTGGANNGNLCSVAWSHDGGRLYAGGTYDSGGQSPILSWPQAGKGKVRELDGADMTIMHVLPLAGGGMAFGAGDPAFGLLSSSGERTLFQAPAIADYRNNREGFLLSGDGKSVRFGYEVRGKSPAVFDPTARRLDQSEPSSSNLYSPDMTSLDITDWKNDDSPRLNGKPLKLKQYEMSFSVAVSPAKDRFLLGTVWYLRYFDASGNERWNTPVPGVAWSVNLARNGKTAAAAFGDGTIRWYRVSDGSELLAFFPHKDRKRWVLWSPSGYYDASPGAEDLIGWHVNNGKDRAADFFPASRFRDRFYRPDVVAKVLDVLDENEAVRLADLAAGKKRQETDMMRLLPPVVTIHGPVHGQEFSSSAVTVAYSVRSPSGEPITSVQALVDGRRVGTKGKPVRPDSDTLSVAVPERDCEIGVIAENRYAASEPAVVRIKWKGKTTDEFVFKPKLYVLAVGVSQYRDKTLNLRYAAKDARDFVDAMKKQKGGLYRDVETTLLTDEQAVKDNILDGLEWLQRQTTAKDTAALLLSGHGMNDASGVYYFLPSDFDEKRIKRTGLMFADIKNTVAAVAGKILVFADTCHAGNIMGGRKGTADINAFVNELASAENGAVVFSSSTGKQVSLERPEWNNGAFTLALVEGISGKAAYGKDGTKITINMLDLYLSERVKELTEGLQTPTTTKPHTVPDFPVAVKR